MDQVRSELALANAQELINVKEIQRKGKTKKKLTIFF